jgi:hypothetical protein
MVRLGISIVLSVTSFFILSTVFDKNFEYIKAAVLFDPYQHAKDLYDENKIADADEFLTFYDEIPYAEITDEMRALHDEIRKKRSSVTYHLSEAARGLIVGESDEITGKTIAFITEFIFIGDLRDLGGEGIKYVHGEEVDKLTVSLAAIGLGMSAVSTWGPQAVAATPTKQGLSLFKRLSKSLKAPMRGNITEVGEISAKLVKAKMEKIAASSSAVVESVKKLDFSSLKKAWDKAPPVDEKAILKNADDIKKLNSSFSALRTTGELYAMDRKAAAFVIKNSDDMRALQKNADLAKRLGKDSGIMLENGGMNTLLAVEKHSPSAIKDALAYGKGGVNYLLTKGSLPSLRTAVRAIKTTHTGKAWYHLRNVIFAMPWQLAIGMVAYMLLTLYKMWFLRPVKQTGRSQWHGEKKREGAYE